MKLRLLEVIRCPSCRGQLNLQELGVEQLAGVGHETLEVTAGQLTCVSCRRSFPIRDGVPRLICDDAPAAERQTMRTSESFGYLWSQSAPSSLAPQSYHFDKMASILRLEQPKGLVMDAGCGDGIDLVHHAARDGVEVVGVELSDGGCRTSAARIRGFAAAHVVQADLRRLPFAEATFDRVYSYGVLHHITSPPAAAAELARVTRRGAEVVIYLYEDFGERSAAWRVALRVVNASRAVTTRLPPRCLYALCQIGSPIVYLLFTVPHRLLKSVPGFRTFARGLPFRHGQGPLRLAGDLYDRFSAPIEHRYSRRGAAVLLQQTGLDVMNVAYERGWMVSARRGGTSPSAPVA